MNKYIYIAVLILLSFLTSCGSSNGKQADNKTEKQVTAVIDSIVASEPDMLLSSLDVIKTQMPPLFADDVQPAVKQSAEMLGAYIFSMALGGKSSQDDDKIIESFVAMGAPLRESMKKYESESHPDYIFGLAKVANTKDSTLNEKRVYIFDVDNLNEVKRVDKYTNKTNKDVGLLFVLAFGDQIDYKNKDLKPEDIKVVHDNPILSFIAEE